MKKKIIVIAIVIFVLMLIPIPNRLKDGGSIEYKAVLYTYTKIHRLSEKSSTGYEDGWELKILGIHVGGRIDTNIIIEHIISIKSNDKIIDAVTGSFCYKNGACIDKINFEDFSYDVVSSYYENKLYIDNLDGSIKSIKLFDYSIREYTDIKVDFTNEYIITPNSSGMYIFVINSIYEGKSIEYYFLVYISKINPEEVNLEIKMKENTLSDRGLTMIVKNQSDKDLSYGYPYTIEKYENGFWRTLKPIKEFAYNLIALGLKRNESIELNINWENSYGRLKGKYRIVKNFHYFEDENAISFDKYLEFEIK